MNLDLPLLCGSSLELISWGLFSVFLGSAFVPIFACAAKLAFEPKRLWAPFRCVVAVAFIFILGYFVYGVLPEFFFDLKLRQRNRLVMAIGFMMGLYVGKFASRVLFKKTDPFDWSSK